MARRPFFTGFPGFRGSLPAPLLAQPPAAAPPIPRRTPKKIPPCHTHCHCHTRCGNPHKQISVLLTRPPWLDIAWQERNTFPALAAQRQAARRREHPQKNSFPEPVEGNIHKKHSFPEPVEGNIQQEDYLLNRWVLRHIAIR